MILDTLTNCLKYASIHPRFVKAFDYLLNNDLSALPVGKVELEEANIIVNIVDIAGKKEEDAQMETHLKYIDIQVPIGQAETMGWKAAAALKESTKPYDEMKDVAFFGDKASLFLNVQPYEFAIFFPEDGHQPGISKGIYRKIIVKIKV